MSKKLIQYNCSFYTKGLKLINVHNNYTILLQDNWLNYISLPTLLINGELDVKNLLAKNELIRWSLQYNFNITSYYTKIVFVYRILKTKIFNDWQ